MVLISTLAGLFYKGVETTKTFTNLFGNQVELYGKGLYGKLDNLAAGTAMGTDIAMLIVAIILLIITINIEKGKVLEIFQAGLMVSLFYASFCNIMGHPFNRLYLIYLVWFSASLYGSILSLIAITKENYFKESILEKDLNGTVVFMIIGGCSVWVWMTMIIPAIISGTPDFLTVGVTEPTFAIDLGIIFPICIAMGVCLKKKKKYAYPIVSVLLTLITCVGVCVIMQTIAQLSIGVVISIGQMIGLVGSFVILGTIAIILNIKLLRYVK